MTDLLPNPPESAPQMPVHQALHDLMAVVEKSKLTKIQHMMMEQCYRTLLIICDNYVKGQQALEKAKIIAESAEKKNQ